MFSAGELVDFPIWMLGINLAPPPATATHPTPYNNLSYHYVTLNFAHLI
jgi:hypothetical protein